MLAAARWGLGACAAPAACATLLPVTRSEGEDIIILHAGRGGVVCSTTSAGRKGLAPL